MQASPFHPEETDMEEQCGNLASCAERLASIIDKQPDRGDLRALHALMENAMGSIRGHRSRRD